MSFAERALRNIQATSLKLDIDPLAELKSFLQSEGFTDVMAREMRNPFDPQFHSAIEIYNGPSELRELYFSRRDVLFDIGMKVCRRSTMPIRWDSLRKMAEGRSLEIMNNLADFGMHQGVVMVHREIDREPIFVSLVGEVASEFGHDELLMVQMLCSHYLTLWLAETPSNSYELDELSPREVEILAASGAGVNGSKLQDVLGITEHTMRSHLRSIRRKLRARSMPHAVQIGLRVGILDG